MVLIFLTNKTMFRTLLTTQPPTSCLLQGTWDLSWHFYSIRVSAFNRLNNNLIKHVNVIQHRLNSPLNRLPLDLNRRWWKRHRVQDGPGSQKVQLGLGADKYCVGMKYPLKFAIKNILVWLWISYIREIQMCCVQKWQMQPEWKTFLLDVALELQISSVGKFAVQQTTPSTFTIARKLLIRHSGLCRRCRVLRRHPGFLFFMQARFFFSTESGKASSEGRIHNPTFHISGFVAIYREGAENENEYFSECHRH